MKKLLLSFSGISVILILNSCSPTYHRTTYPANGNQPSTMTGSSSTSASQIEREYPLIKTYKSETAEVLTDLLNGSQDSQKDIDYSRK